jgi:hypothetical protein
MSKAKPIDAMMQISHWVRVSLGDEAIVLEAGPNETL